MGEKKRRELGSSGDVGTSFPSDSSLVGGCEDGGKSVVSKTSVGENLGTPGRRGK